MSKIKSKLINVIIEHLWEEGKRPQLLINPVGAPDVLVKKTAPNQLVALNVGANNVGALLVNDDSIYVEYACDGRRHKDFILIDMLIGVTTPDTPGVFLDLRQLPLATDPDKMRSPTEDEVSDVVAEEPAPQQAGNVVSIFKKDK